MPFPRAPDKPHAYGDAGSAEHTVWRKHTSGTQNGRRETSPPAVLENLLLIKQICAAAKLRIGPNR